MSFVNPYNFVTLEGKCDKRVRPIPTCEKRDGEPLYTGVLQCALTTLSPLFIPNTTSNNAFPQMARDLLAKYNRDNRKREENASKSYDFYSYTDLSKSNSLTDAPVIPGSSIRGVVRGVYETVTNSCMSTCGGRETPLYRRTPTPKPYYGVIKDGVLYRAAKYVVKVNNLAYSPHPFGNNMETANLAHGQEVWFTPTRDQFQSRNIRLNYGVQTINANGVGIQGFYLKGEPFGSKKHFDAVMAPVKDAKTGEWTKVYELKRDDHIRLETLLTLYTKDKDGVNQTKGHGEYKGFLKAPVVPVYYSNVGDKYYISPACITKDVFDRTIASILREQGGFDACADSGKLCEACHLFGMVGSGKDTAARSSRVQFRDALPTEQGGYLGEPTALAILGSPKITATEFYMIPDKTADVFNYDYKVENKRAIALDNAKLRGRKYYWHHASAPKVNKPDDRPDLYQIVRPVLSGKTFGFSVAFERLTIDELKKLRFALELDESGAHKLGHGKPIGYGSVKISVDREASRVYALNDALEIVPSPLPNEAFAFTFDNADFKALTDIKNPRKGIDYPSATAITNRGQSRTVYNWFVQNKEASGGNSTTRPIFAYVLPRASAKDASLPELTKTDRNITCGRGSNREQVWEAFRK